jgi:iron-sulfur cluster repair protein YtfE (RIC family)
MKTTVDIGATSVNEIIRLYPQTVEVFNRHGLDACCGGAACVTDAAVRDGADAATVIEELRAIIERTA